MSRPDGNPAAGASVYLLQESPMATDPVAVVQTDTNGAFEFDIAKNLFNDDETSEPWLIAKVLAKAEGFGPALGRWRRALNPAGRWPGICPYTPT